MYLMRLSQIISVSCMFLLFSGCGDTNGSLEPQGNHAATEPSIPSMEQIMPTHSPSSGGVEVIIHGKGFSAGTKVFFANQSATSVNVISDSDMKVITPALPGVQGPVPVTVTTHDAKGDHSTTQEQMFFYQTVSMAFGSNLTIPKIEPTVFIAGIHTVDKKPTLVSAERDVASGDTNIFLNSFDVGVDSIQRTSMGSTSESVYSLDVLDINQDGHDDIVIGTSEGNLILYLTDITGKWFPPSTFFIGYKTKIRSVRASDLNQDGYTDLIVSDNLYITTLLGNQRGGFQPRAPIVAGRWLSGMDLLDYNQDGYIDVVVNDGGDLFLLSSMHDGTFDSPKKLDEFQSVAWFSVRDITGDKRDDIVILTDNKEPKILTYINNLKSFKQTGSASVPRGSFFFFTLDLDGDDAIDVVTHDNDGHFSFLLGNSDGTFAPLLSFTTSPGTSLLRITDISGDNKPDLITFNNSGGTPTVNVHLNESK